ncbi:hypothetical protein BUALT_Bualt07G0101000 [Buddleja alternifolia]|uniref:Uncharacterized protein n=1 Tax=Buddleja alternifolia TaxID=168488 RepID=A0AAV6XKD5_9LAMI|nr:hypothetical protein BUALT_Bualt07G0101000 [Buddleja alternifolia]
MCLKAICLRRWHAIGVGSQFSSAKMVSTLGCYCVPNGACLGVLDRRHTIQASSFLGSSACLPQPASIFLVLNTHNGGTRLVKTSHFHLVLRPSGSRRGVDLKAFAVRHVPCKFLRMRSGCWLMECCSISRMRNNESSWLGSCEIGVDEECYLVDPASSHMLVSKIKPCMCRASGAVTLKKLECSKQAYALYTLAWDNIIGFRSYYVGLRDRKRKLGARRRSDTVLVSTINDADQGSADVAYRTPPAPYEKSKSLGSGGSPDIIIAIVGLQRGISSKHESSARVDYVPALCIHRQLLLPIEWSGEVFGSRRRGRFAARDVARSPLNLII